MPELIAYDSLRESGASASSTSKMTKLAKKRTTGALSCTIRNNIPSVSNASNSAGASGSQEPQNKTSDAEKDMMSVVQSCVESPPDSIGAGNDEETFPFLGEFTMPIIPFPPRFVTLKS